MSDELKNLKIEPRAGARSIDVITKFNAGMQRLPYVLGELGYESLRPGQDKAIKTIMAGRDAVTILPTATGKSACFVIPTLCMEWRTIVIYPLIALMRDQASGMLRNGLAAASISSHESDAHNASVLREWAAGNLQFMLVSPERFSNTEWASVVSQFPPDMVAMDECHTFYEWADTFRSGYKFAGKFIQEVRPKVVAAFSATLSEDAEQEVREGLGIQEAKLVYHYPRRENLLLSTLYVDRIQDAVPWVADNCEGPTVVYATSRKRTEEYADAISRFTNRPVFFYHGGMNATDRKFQMEKFMRERDSIIVATNAFGMGVDKSDIRNVVHFDMPSALVALAQEVGRAGRDGADSNCVIIPHKKAIQTCRHFIRCGSPTQAEIRSFWDAAVALKEGKTGVVTAKRDDIAYKAGVDPFLVQAIMTFCLGEGMMVADTSAARKSRIRFLPDIPSFTKTEAETRNAILDVAYEEDGWLHMDIDALAEQLDKDASTIMSRLRKMHNGDKIEWIRASTSRPLRLLKPPEEVPLESFERLDAKAKQANADLQMVLDYCDTADEDKHDFLESHLNR